MIGPERDPEDYPLPPMTTAADDDLTHALTHLSLVDAAALFARGELRAERYVGALYAAAARHANLNATLALREDAALREAARADASARSGAGPLAGVPFLVKANIETADLPANAGTPGLVDLRPVRNAPAVQRLVDAGAIVLGTTNMDELALHVTGNNAAYGPIRNPRALDRIAGGSSGGNGAALAAGLAPLALGTDTGGSVRIPAALTGTVGFRPSFGRYPAEGVVPISTTLDTIGVMTRTVADAARVDAVLAGAEIDGARPAAAGRAEPRAPVARLGVPRAWFQDVLDPAVARAFEAALERLAAAGVELVRADLPEPASSMMDAYAIAGTFECVPALSAYLWARSAAVDVADLAALAATPAVKESLERMLGADEIPPAIHRGAMRWRRSLREQFTRYLESHRVEAIVYPCTPVAATPLGEDEVVRLGGRDVPLLPLFLHNTVFSPVIGGPALTMPMLPATEGGLPVGLEIAAGPGADRALLALGAALEDAVRGARPVVASPAEHKQQRHT
jgi:indoleacetamide hydrolase